MKLSQIISVLATVTALTGAFFLIREETVMAMRAMGLWVIFYYGWLFAENYEYEDKE